MIIKSSAPSRISLFGGSTDLPDYFLKYGGIVISMAINLRTEVTLTTEDDLWTNAYTKLPYKADPQLCYSILNNYQLGSMHFSRVQSTFDGEVKAGLGSSASFAIALIAALKRTRNERIDKQKLITEAWEAERLIGKKGGIQDQYAAAYGGFNIFNFKRKKTDIFAFDNTIGDHISEYLILYYTGGHRDSGKIQIKRMTTDKIKHLNQIKDIALLAQRAIIDGRTDLIGKLLHATWEEKKLSNNVSNDNIDRLYDIGRQNGALGGKLCGAGGSGYMIFWVDPNKQQEFKKQMSKEGLEPIDFSIDYQGLDTRIL